MIFIYFFRLLGWIFYYTFWSVLNFQVALIFFPRLRVSLPLSSRCFLVWTICTFIRNIFSSPPTFNMGVQPCRNIHIFLKDDTFLSFYLSLSLSLGSVEREKEYTFVIVLLQFSFCNKSYIFWCDLLKCCFPSGNIVNAPANALQRKLMWKKLIPLYHSSWLSLIHAVLVSPNLSERLCLFFFFSPFVLLFNWTYARYHSYVSDFSTVCSFN